MARFRLLTVFQVGFQQFRYGWLLGRWARRGRRDCRTAKAPCQCLTDTADALGPHTRYLAESAIRGGGFQLGKGFDSEVFVDATSSLEPDARQREELVLRVRMTSQSQQESQPSSPGQPLYGAPERLANPRQAREAVHALRVQDLVDWVQQIPHGPCRRLIRVDPKAVGSLALKQIGHFLKGCRNLLIVQRKHPLRALAGVWMHGMAPCVRYCAISSRSAIH
jgi:hypothetical protein